MSAIDFRTIVAEFRAVVDDGPDLDFDPDVIPISGQVSFIPVFQGQGITVGTTLYRPQTQTGSIYDGKLVWLTAGEDSEDVVEQPLRLPVTQDARHNQDWYYSVRFDNIVVNRVEQKIPPTTLTVPPGEGALNLWEYVGEISGGVLHTRGAPCAGVQRVEQDGSTAVFVLDTGERLAPVELPAPVPYTPVDSGEINVTVVDGLILEPRQEHPGLKSGEVPSRFTVRRVGDVVILTMQARFGPLERLDGYNVELGSIPVEMSPTTTTTTTTATVVPSYSLTVEVTPEGKIWAGAQNLLLHMLSSPTGVHATLVWFAK